MATFFPVNCKRLKMWFYFWTKKDVIFCKLVLPVYRERGNRMFSNCCSILCQKQNLWNPMAPITIKKPDTLPFANWSHNNQLPNDHNEKDWATKIRERSNGRGVVALSRLTHTWLFLTLQELWLLPLVLIAPRQSGAFLLLLSLSRPKSMEHEFRCVTNLLNLYNSINIIKPK